MAKGWQADNTGGGSGRTPRRRTTNRVQGGDDGGRSHGGEMADDSRGQPMAAEQVMVEPEAETESR